MNRNALALALLLAPGGAWAEPVVRADDPRIARMGRTVARADGSLRFAYPGVQLSLAFEGKALSVDAAASGERSILDVVVDGGAARIVKLSAKSRTIKLVDERQGGIHRVDIMHRTESWHGVVTLARFVADGTLHTAPVLPQRKMLVLGDSVTCGEAIDRVDSGVKKPSWWNPRASYAMLAAQTLGAQVHLVCHGGRGLLRSWNGRTDNDNLPDFYELAIANEEQRVRWDHAGYWPDVIVSAIGTNDFSTGIPERDSYVKAYESLVRTLLRNHPHALIVLTEGALLNGERKAALNSYIAETIRRVGSTRVHAATTMHHPGDATDAHPTRAQHAAMARELVPQLRDLTGW
ncbi:bifunctional acetylxylan esterase/glucomannan deacetylase AxeC2 [Massilia scottii]|uniref:bifunctional acetylxylan esterase/glucomannan deacetylase AxeC2 n=1 Tax=Massilia scottii TaxID=3057166 RepID=UPI00279673AC|nr:bifunctional acetylxylan esterase/glucomannan deacetylase AxeC2 [Massilia sp. CCM 9029]MDQ1829768.1 GDSL-type esterase/lipase family protein [Massilia sp. CCM 9029]